MTETYLDPENEGWRELDGLNRKVYASHRAYQSSEEDVKNLTDFDLSTILDIASRYAGYDLQLRILSDDQSRLQDELEDFDGSQALDIYKGWRMELESAIRNAQLGNYTALKQWFKICQKRQEYPVVDIDLQTKLNKIVEIIPDEAESLQLPQPAWLDPEFNTDTTP